MASAKRTASGKWSCVVYIGIKDGKRKQKRFTADTKKEAERAAHQYVLDHPLNKDISDLTVEQAIISYIDVKSEILSPSTVAGYQRILKHRFQKIKSLPIGEITKEQIQSAVNEEAKTLSPKTVSNAVGLLTAALSLQKIDISGISLPQKKKIEVIIPTDEEMSSLCSSAPEWDISLPVYLAAYMGMRRSEICAIDLSKDVDLNAKTIRINKAMVINQNNEKVIKGTKTTNSTRTLPIPSVVYPVVEDAVHNKYQIPTPGAVEARFIKMKRSLGMDHITFHSLRHYFASTLVVMEIPDFYAMKLMGHNSDRMLKNVYQHIRQDYMQEVSNKMDAFFTSKNQVDD